MKLIVLSLLLWLSWPAMGQIVELPITFVRGYGPFGVGFSRLTPDQRLDANYRKMTLPVNGIPKAWISPQKAMVRINTWQLIYQNVLAGNVSSAWYKGYQHSRQLALDDAEFAKQPIKCYVYVVKGFEPKRGKWLVRIDTNNNLDLSDETSFEPQVIKPGAPADDITDARLVTYQTFQKGRIVTAQLPMVVKRMGDELFFNFPQYAQATLPQSEGQIDLVVSNGFLGMNFDDITTVARQPQWFWQTKLATDELTEIGGIITLGGKRYKNKGVRTYANALELEIPGSQSKEYSLTLGEVFPPFVAADFRTGKSISLAACKGKWVYIDFWGTWCKPCLATIPTLKRLYQGSNRARIEFIGIAGNQDPQQLQRFLA
ncbi:MAG: TlpA family protein disulfide reductase, partial [Cytophagaceae bacterium]